MKPIDKTGKSGYNDKADFGKARNDQRNMAA